MLLLDQILTMSLKKGIMDAESVEIKIMIFPSQDKTVHPPFAVLLSGSSPCEVHR